MRTFDFTPLHRATIGFDQIADLLDRTLSADTPQSSYPPYNIEKIDADSYRISIAVAGFSADDLNVELKENALVVVGQKVNSASDTPQRSYLHRGIATRAFERRFTLADHVRVTGASHENGMLHIDLQREIPEALKPRRIEISTASQSVSAGVSRAIDAERVLKQTN